MRTALLLTAFDRPDLFEQVLDTWCDARRLERWHLRIALEPGPAEPRVRALAEAFVRQVAHPDAQVVTNERRLGVALNPYHHLGDLFRAGHDFVVRAEDDLPVADDVLPYFEHVAHEYADDRSVATAHAFARGSGQPAAIRRTPAFCPWVWGTWRDRWDELIGPTWDRDYSTWNESPGFESGWDWNLNTRVFPGHGLSAIEPLASRVDNIGVTGAHGTAENLVRPERFDRRLGSPRYTEVR